MTSRPDDGPRAPLPVDLERLLHDLRGPLNAAVMHLEVLKRLQGDDATARASMASIQSELERMAAMLPRAFSVCALEPGPRTPVSLRAVVESAVDDGARKRLTIDEGAWPEIDGDERLLRLAIGHILINALEASGDHAGAQVSVSRDEHQHTVTLAVRDHGPGFRHRNPAAAVRLMASTKPGHAGIGLLVAQRVARLHGGTLAIETLAAGGAVVRFIVRARS